MPDKPHRQIFSQLLLEEIFPNDRTDRFFDALYGDASEGAYDIALVYTGETADQIHFEFQLKQRPGRCLACNLTYGLPDVFKRHPIIDLKGIVGQICDRIAPGRRCKSWALGRTDERSASMHVLPLTVELEVE